MRAEWKTRKAKLKKYQAMLSGDLTVYDFTESEARDKSCDDHAIFTLAEFPLLATLDDPSDEALEINQIKALTKDFKAGFDIFNWASCVLSHSPLAASLWKDAAKKGWSIEIRSLERNNFDIDSDSKILTLDDFSMTESSIGRSSFFRNALIMNIVRLLRDVWHEGNLSHMYTHYCPEDVLMIERVRSADCDTVALMCAWELRGAGFADIWRSVIGSPEGDMALAFTNMLEHAPKAFMDGSALRQAFREWFCDTVRVNGCDHETLETLDDHLIAFDCHARTSGAHIFDEDLEDIGRLPDGSCYLKNMGHNLRTDAHFTDMDDPINQAHLTQMLYDMNVVMVHNVPFRDTELAAKIFPDL